MKLHDARIVVFDNDGTLYPAGEEVGKAVLTAHRQYVIDHGLDIPTPDQSWVKAMIGVDAKEFYPAMMPGQPADVVAEFEEFCLELEMHTVRRFPDLYLGAEEMLALLKANGKVLALVTNGGPRYVKNVWDTAGYGEFFSASYPYAPPDYLTKGERLALAVKEAGGGPAVMIGDRSSDREAAAEAGTMFIGCRYGYGLKGELDGADAIIDSLLEIKDLLINNAE